MANKTKAYEVAGQLFATQEAADRFEFGTVLGSPSVGPIPATAEALADFLIANRAQVAPFLKVTATRKARTPKPASASPSAPAAGSKKK